MAVIWITGLPGVGKTEVARARGAPPRERRIVRRSRRRRPSRRARAARRRLRRGGTASACARLLEPRVARVAQGHTAVVATVSLIAEVHRENRAGFARYLEVLLTCEQGERDRRRPPDSLRGARHGVEIAPQFPAAPHLSLATDAATPESLALRILARWHANGDAEIACAVEASSVARLHEAKRRMIEAGVVQTPIVRGEPPGEHARRLGARECAMLEAKFAEISAWLGYPSVPDRGGATASPDAHVHAALLVAIRRAGVPVAERSWLADALAAASCGIRLSAQAEPPDGTTAASRR